MAQAMSRGFQNGWSCFLDVALFFGLLSENPQNNATRVASARLTMLNAIDSQVARDFHVGSYGYSLYVAYASVYLYFPFLLNVNATIARQELVDCWSQSPRSAQPTYKCVASNNGHIFDSLSFKANKKVLGFVDPNRIRLGIFELEHSTWLTCGELFFNYNTFLNDVSCVSSSVILNDLHSHSSCAARTLYAFPQIVGAFHSEPNFKFQWNSWGSAFTHCIWASTSTFSRCSFKMRTVHLRWSLDRLFGV